MYILNLVTKILHFLKLKYKESNLQDEPPCSNVTTLQTGSLTCTWDVSHSVHRGSGGGGHSLLRDTKDCTPFNVIHATDIHQVCKDVRTQKF